MSDDLDAVMERICKFLSMHKMGCSLSVICKYLGTRDNGAVEELLNGLIAVGRIDYVETKLSVGVGGPPTQRYCYVG